MTDEAAGHRPSPPWGSHALMHKNTVAVRLGSRDIWIRKRDGEIWIADEDRGRGLGDIATWGTGEPPPEPELGHDWSRWAPPGQIGEVVLRPILPNRSIVLHPEWPFRLLSGAEARVFVRVPLWIRVEIPVEGKVHAITALPSVGMSDTWWGDLNGGELAYWLDTTARRAIEPTLFAPHLAVCPLHMRNETEAELQVDKLALRVAHLSLFDIEGRIWADESRVLYAGHEEGSQIEMAGRPPREAVNAVLICPPATKVPRGFRARTFDRLRALHALGMFG